MNKLLDTNQKGSPAELSRGKVAIEVGFINHIWLALRNFQRSMKSSTESAVVSNSARAQGAKEQRRPSQGRNKKKS